MRRVLARYCAHPAPAPPPPSAVACEAGFGRPTGDSEYRAGTSEENRKLLVRGWGGVGGVCGNGTGRRDNGASVCDVLQLQSQPHSAWGRCKGMGDGGPGLPVPHAFRTPYLNNSIDNRTCPFSLPAPPRPALPPLCAPTPARPALSAPLSRGACPAVSGSQTRIAFTFLPSLPTFPPHRKLNRMSSRYFVSLPLTARPQRARRATQITHVEGGSRNNHWQSRRAEQSSPAWGDMDKP